MNARISISSGILMTLALQGALAAPAYAAGGAVFYDSQTQSGWSTASQVDIEGMAWGYYHTGPLTKPLTISASDPVAIQLFDKDQGERNVGGSDDELQLWMSDTDLTVPVGESVRFEFFSVVPVSQRKAASETFEKELEIKARFSDAPGTFATEWNASSWSVSSQSYQTRAASFEGYPAADHVVRLYYVHPGRGFSGLSPAENPIDVVVHAGDKKVFATAYINDAVYSSSTNEQRYDNTPYKGLIGTIVVENTSDRDGLTVDLDYVELWDRDDTSADDLVVEASSTAPASFNLGPGGTLKWVIDTTPKWEKIEEARDFFALGEGDLDLEAVFSVNGDPDLPLVFVSDEEFAALRGDQPDTTFSFGAGDPDAELPPPPVVAFSGGAESYFVDEDVSITCAVTDMGGGIVYHTCQDVDAPAWTFPAGTTTYTASAFDVFGQEGTDSVSFEVLVDPDSLIAITERFVDHAGIENSLVKKIEAAAKAKTNSAQDAACEAYIHEVEAQSGKYVSELYAEVLIYWAQQLALQ